MECDVNVPVLYVFSDSKTGTFYYEFTAVNS